MFKRTDLFRIRDVLVEVFHTATDDTTRRAAFDRVLKINERLLRAGRRRLMQPGWAA